MNKILFILLMILCAGCSLIPAYHRPAAPVASQWTGAASTGEAVAADIGWREFFVDPRLQKLIELALANNRDLRIAMLNVAQTRAQYRILGYALYPGFNGQLTGQRQRDVASSGNYTKTRKYSVGLETSYEVDLFGQIRSLKAQALEQYLATDEAKQGAQLTLVAEVAVTYLQERAAQEQLEVSRKTLETVKASYDLIKKSYDLGNASELDLRSAEAQVQAAQVNIATYERERFQLGDALVFLIGQPLPADLPQPRPMSAQALLADLEPGLPSDLLDRRPDILAAEHRLMAANANIGAVRAAFFPKITLTASGGTSSVQLAKLFTPGSQVWNFTPQIILPIFDRSTNRANLDVAQIGKSIEVAQYEKAVQNAFREVADGLAARATFLDQIAAQKALVEAQQKRYQLADERYRNGLDNYLTVLIAQQDLYLAEQNLIQADLARLSNLIGLYKALGGGWKE